MNLIILSRNPTLYSTQSLVDAARIRNHYVRVLDHMYCDLILDNKGTKIYYNNQHIKNVDAIIPRIGTSATSFGANVIRSFVTQGVFSTLDVEPLLNSRDKLTCLQILSHNNVPVPKTMYLSNSATMPQMLDDMGAYPMVIKLVTGTQGLGVILAESKQSAESIIEAFHSTKDKVIVQKFIKESKGTDIRVFIVDGKIVGSMKRTARTGDFRSNLHRGGSSEIVELTNNEAETALKAVEVLGLKIAGVDMLQSHVGPVVLEVNASPGLEGIEHTTGSSISKQIISYIEQNVRI